MSLDSARYFEAFNRSGQTGHVHAGRVVGLLRDLVLADDEVAQMLLVAMRPGDVPTAPTVGERARLVGVVGTRSEDRETGAVNVDRSHHEAGNALRLRVGMAQQARIGLPGDPRPLERLLIEGVEHGAELGIDDRDFHHVAVGTITDVDIVIEVHRPRCLGAIRWRWKLVLEKTSICDEVGTPRDFSSDRK